MKYLISLVILILYSSAVVGENQGPLNVSEFSLSLDIVCDNEADSTVCPLNTKFVCGVKPGEIDVKPYCVDQNGLIVEKVYCCNLKELLREGIESDFVAEKTEAKCAPPYYTYSITCKCKLLDDEPITGNSTASEFHARLTVGAVCSALEHEKETIKKEQMSEEDQKRIQPIVDAAMKAGNSGNVDHSVLNLIHDCTTISNL